MTVSLYFKGCTKLCKYFLLLFKLWIHIDQSTVVLFSFKSKCFNNYAEFYIISSVFNAELKLILVLDITEKCFLHDIIFR